MSKQDLKYSDITEKIIGCAMKVHRFLGPGFPEVIYKRALIIEFEVLGLNFQTEVEKSIVYENHILGKRRLDLTVNDLILLELKAVSELNDACHAQIINYLKVFKLEVGLLLNFGSKSLQFKRFINTI